MIFWKLHDVDRDDEHVVSFLDYRYALPRRGDGRWHLQPERGWRPGWCSQRVSSPWSPSVRRENPGPSAWLQRGPTLRTAYAGGSERPRVRREQLSGK